MKEYTIGKLFNLAKFLLSDESVTHRKSLKTTIAIRHMLRVNSDELLRLNETINSEIDEIVNEVYEDFKGNDKALEDRIIKEEYRDEFDSVVQGKLQELSIQKMPANFVYVSMVDVQRYFMINDGELTEAEMDAIETFANDEELANDTPEQ